MIVPRVGDLVTAVTSLTEHDRDWRGLPVNPRNKRWEIRSSPNANVREMVGLWLGLLGKEGQLLDNEQRRTVLRAIEAGRDPTKHVSPLYGVIWTIGKTQERRVILIEEDTLEISVESAAPRTRP